MLLVSACFCTFVNVIGMGPRRMEDTAPMLATIARTIPTGNQIDGRFLSACCSCVCNAMIEKRQYSVSVSAGRKFRQSVSPISFSTETPARGNGRELLVDIDAESSSMASDAHISVIQKRIQR